jgi:hypothetical protein
MRVFGTPASIDVQASVWKMFLTNITTDTGFVPIQYWGYRWNRMYDGYGTLLSDATGSTWSSTSGPGAINQSFTISPQNNYLGNTSGSGTATIRARARPFIKSGVFEGPGTTFLSFPQLGTTTPNQILWNNNEDAVFWSRNVSPYIYAATFSPSGWGTLYANPVTASPGNGTIGVNLATNDVALQTGTGGGISAINAWTFSTSTGWGTKLSDPAAGFPTASSNKPAFTKNGDAIVCHGNNSPYVFVYPWIAGLGFGTKYADPAANLNGVTFSSWNPAQTVLGLSANTTAINTKFHQWSSSTGWGTQYSPQSSIAFTPSWSPDGKSVGGGSFGTDTLTYRWDDATGFGTQYSNPVQPIGSDVSSAYGFFSN